MEIDPIDERIRKLCLQAADAHDAELEALLAELRLALREHARFVKRMAAQTLSHLTAGSSSSQAAD